MDDLQKLSQEEKELEEKLRALRERRRRLEEEHRKIENAHAEALKEDERLEKMKAPTIVYIQELSGGSLRLVTEGRPDVVEVIKAHKHYHRGQKWTWIDQSSTQMQHFMVPVATWPKVEEELEALNDLTIKWEKGVAEELDWFLNAPPWEVVMHPDGRHLLAKAGPEQAKNGHRLLVGVPGANYDYDDKSWKLPTSEAWRIFDAMEEIEGVVYDEAAKDCIFGQVEARAKLDEIAQADDAPEIHVRWSEDDFELRPFQRAGVKFGEIAKRFILADQTGLGKTIQAIAIAERGRREAGDEDFQTIVVCPAHLKTNWKREIERLTGVVPYVCSGQDPGKYAIEKIIGEAHPYVIINYDILGHRKVIKKEGKQDKNVFRWAVILKMAKPDLLVVDEAHYIKNPDAFRSQACRKLTTAERIIPMTATPVLNRANEMWPLLYMVEPEVFASRVKFEATYGTKNPKNVDKLREMLRPRYLRRTKKEVLKDLPPINRMTEFHELSDRGQELYKKVIAGVWEAIEEYDSQGRHGGQQNVMSILAEITRLKQVCAIDKAEHTAGLATSIIDGADNGGKVLIFSHFKASALNIAQQLGSQAVCTVRRGTKDFVSLNADKRDDLFERVRNDDSIRYVVTTQASQEGHNLEFCDWVIFNDLFWTPSAHKQCEGRAYGRLSDPHPIDSYYIVTSDTIEDWIIELLEKKLRIIEEVTEGVELSRGEDDSIANELIEKMREEMWLRG